MLIGYTPQEAEEMGDDQNNVDSISINQDLGDKTPANELFRDDEETVDIGDKEVDTDNEENLIDAADLARNVENGEEAQEETQPENTDQPSVEDNEATSDSGDLKANEDEVNNVATRDFTRDLAAPELEEATNQDDENVLNTATAAEEETNEESAIDADNESKEEVLADLEEKSSVMEKGDENKDEQNVQEEEVVVKDTENNEQENKVIESVPEPVVAAESELVFPKEESGLNTEMQTEENKNENESAEKKDATNVRNDVTV
jgi:hypothetical protein